jgi:hypothetical protein
MLELKEVLKFSLHHYESRKIKHVTKLKIDTYVTYMNDVGYHTFLDHVTADPLYKCSYHQ